MQELTALGRANRVVGQLPREKANVIERSLRGDSPVSYKVKAFHIMYDMPVARVYTPLTPERLAMRVGLVLEEFSEFLYKSMGITMESTFWTGKTEEQQNQAEADNKGYLTAAIECSNQFDPVEGADAAGDSIYVWHGLFQELGLDLDAVITEIHASNMTKLGADGNPIYRADGKVLKGPNYMPPQIARVLDASMDGPMDPEERLQIFSGGNQ